MFGIGAKIFTIAGPVILYGILSSWALGVVYWIGKCLVLYPICFQSITGYSFASLILAS